MTPAVHEDVCGSSSLPRLGIIYLSFFTSLIVSIKVRILFQRQDISAWVQPEEDPGGDIHYEI